MSNTILEGIKVLDLANENGVFCTRLLAQLGAEVIKVEAPQGDPIRYIAPFAGGKEDIEKGLFHNYYNEGKKSITLDIQQNAGREIFRQLVKDADVLVETSRPGTMEALGLDYDSLSSIAPQIIMCSITPFGQTGPYAQWNASSDIIPYALGGPMFETGTPGREPLQLGLNFTADLSGVIAVSGIIALIYARARDGLGDYMDISLFETSGTWRGESYGVAQYQNRVLNRLGAQGMFVPMNYYPCKDGYVQVLGAGKWEQCVQWMKEKGIDVGRFDGPEYGGPSYFNEALVRDKDEVNALMVSLTSMYGKQEFMEEAQARNIPAGASETAFSVLASPHYNGRGLFTKINSPAIGEYTATGSPMNFSQAEMVLGKGAPLLGQDNEEIYGRLGIAAEKLHELKAQAVI